MHSDTSGSQRTSQEPGCAHYLDGDQNTKTLLQIKYSGGQEPTSCTFREKERKENQFWSKMVQLDEGLLNLNGFCTSVAPWLVLTNTASLPQWSQNNTVVSCSRRPVRRAVWRSLDFHYNNIVFAEQWENVGLKSTFNFVAFWTTWTKTLLCFLMGSSACKANNTLELWDLILVFFHGELRLQSKVEKGPRTSSGGGATTWSVFQTRP